MVGLEEAVQGWDPAPVSMTARLDGEPVRAFARLLDQPAPPVEDGAAIPPGWHWFAFLDRPATAELGPDGHPRDGHFLPPIPDRRRMFAGGRLWFTGPPRVGDRLTRSTSLVAREVKHGRSGDMLFVTLRSELRRDETLLLVEEEDIVYRSQSAGVARPRATGVPAATGPVPGPAADDLVVEIAPDSRMLFRFSALTYNAHRIHYDEPYATRVEGYPGLVVHGPLLALLLLEVPRRHLPGRRVASFSYRLTNPTFAGVPVRATGRADGDEVRLAAGAVTNPPSIQGTAVLDPEDR